MADEIVPSAGVEAAVVDAAPAVVVDAPAPAAEVVAASAVETPAEPAAIETPEVVAASEIKADGEGDPEVKPELPASLAYDDFKLPEGFQAAPDQIKAFSDLIGSHQVPQETAQKLIDLHTAEMAAFAERTVQAQQDAFIETRQGWVKDFEERAGNRRDTIINDAKWAIGQLVPSAEKRKEIWSVLAFTGAGDHFAVINLMAAAAKKMREPSTSPNPTPNKSGRGLSAADRRYAAK
jgi:hypothetical protein